MADPSPQKQPALCQPSFIWKHTDLDGVIPVANYTQDVKVTAGGGKRLASQAVKSHQQQDICKVTSFDSASDDEGGPVETMRKNDYFILPSSKQVGQVLKKTGDSTFLVKLKA